MSWDDGLTGTARNIAATDENPLRVMAGPGTGKSFAMKRRVARLLETGQDPRRVLAVTFTRNAAASLVGDLHALGIADCDKVRVGTLHAFCFGLLCQQEVFDYLGRVPRPIVTKLNKDLVQALSKPEVLKRLADQGIDARTSTPEQFAAYIKTETVKWQKVVRDAGLEAE